MRYACKCSIYGILFFLLVVTISISDAKAWWDEDWNQKRPINITNAGGALTDYQVFINVTYDEDMNSDFSDIRFLNGTEDTELDFWLENKSDDEWAYFWVEIPSIPNGANENLTFMYYGNAGAGSTSNGNETFPFFDDFIGTGLDTDWVNLDSITVAVGDGILNITGSAPGAWNCIRNMYVFQIPSVIGIRMMADDHYLGVGGLRYNEAPGGIAFEMSYSNPDQLWRIESTFGQSPGEFGDPYSLSTWYAMEGYAVSGEPTIYVDHNTTEKLSTDYEFIEYNLTLCSATTTKNFIDWLYVREYAASEPTLAIGDEESNPSEGTSVQLWLNNTEGSIECSYGCTLNATALVNVTDLIIQIYKDDVLIANDTTLVSDITLWEAGNHSIMAYTPGNGTYLPSNVTYYANISKISSGISLTSSSGWNIQQGTETTVECTATPSVSLYKDSVGISNPYTATLPFGTYNMSCEIDDIENYTSAYASNSLNIIYSGTGCINTTAYIYTSTIADTPGETTLDFTDLASQYIVNSDLSDVYVLTSNVSVKTMLNATRKYLFINTTNVTDITLQFGNVFASNEYDNDTAVNESLTSFSYSQIADYYYTVNVLNELNGTMLYPIPSANTSITLNCENGADTRNVTAGTFSFPTLQQLSSARVTAGYSATSIYYRDLQVSSPIQFLNFYMVDAMEYQVVQILINLQDNTGDFGGSTLYMTKLLGGQSIKITELPFDIEDKVIVYLMNGGIYQSYVTNGVNTRGTGNLFVDNVNLIKQIVLYEQLEGVTSEWNVTYNVSMNNVTGDISFYWYDPFNQTEQINVSIYNDTNDALLTTFSSTNSSSIIFNYDGDPDGQYRVTMSVTHPMFSNHPFIFSWTLSVLSSILPIIGPGFPTFSSTIIFWASFAAITGAGMLFDQRNGALAGIIVAIVAAVLVHIGWWEIGNAVPALAGAMGIMLIALAVMNKFSEKRRVSD